MPTYQTLPRLRSTNEHRHTTAHIRTDMTTPLMERLPAHVLVLLLLVVAASIQSRPASRALHRAKGERTALPPIFLVTSLPARQQSCPYCRASSLPMARMYPAERSEEHSAATCLEASCWDPSTMLRILSTPSANGAPRTGVVPTASLHHESIEKDIRRTRPMPRFLSTRPRTGSSPEHPNQYNRAHDRVNAHRC